MAKKGRKIAPAEGERIAISGYYPQYQIFAEILL